jgi:hypothetical protein
MGVFYQSEEYIKTGSISSALAGNAPFIINKNSGELSKFGTAFDVDYYINQYDTALERL